MPAARSQLVTVRRPRANNNPARILGKESRWRASSTRARIAIQPDNSAENCHVAILGSPAYGVVVDTNNMRGEPFFLPDQFTSKPTDRIEVLRKCRMIGTSARFGKLARQFEADRPALPVI